MPADPGPEPFDPAVAVARRVLFMVECLHRRGYQRLRIAPAWSPSGAHWRCAVAPREAFSAWHGARLREDADVEARSTTGTGAACFGWNDAVHDAPPALADRFIARFPSVAAAGWGADPAYAQWFAWMVRVTAPDGVPYAAADYDIRMDVVPVAGPGRLTHVALPPAGRAPEPSGAGPVADLSPEPAEPVWMSLGGEHPAQALWARRDEVAPYPDGVAAIGRMIAGTAFFPGGAGLWRPAPARRLPPWPDGGVMVLGHNFDSVPGYERSFAEGEERETAPTWRHLLEVLDAADVRRDACFYTNAFIGLTEHATNVGPFPGATDPEFVARCLRFLAVQLSMQRPRTIVVLGRHVPPLLARLSPTLSAWTAVPGSLAALDQHGTALVRDVVFPHDPMFRSHVVALVHPSYAHVNRPKRVYGAETGSAAEIALVRAAVAYDQDDTGRGAPSTGTP